MAWETNDKFERRHREREAEWHEARRERDRLLLVHGPKQEAKADPVGSDLDIDLDVMVRSIK